MQNLKIYQSLWGMEQRHPSNPEPGAEENFQKILTAGFDGVCIDFGADEIDDFAHLKQHFENTRLECMVNAFPARVNDLRPILAAANEFDATIVNVIGGVMPVNIAGAIPVLYRWMQDADDASLPVLFETHRDGILNDLYFTLEVIDSLPELRLCADLSHFVVDREFWSPLSERDQGFISRILTRSDCFQGRVANREQIQIQIDFPQHQEWVAIFKGWWKEGMRKWRQRNEDDADLIFLCELGPPSYAMTDANALELSDRWQEALTIKRWAEEIWTELNNET
jgi:hypothetical protein